MIDAAAGRVPVWAGCTHNSTRTLRQAAMLRQVPGVDVVLSANPYYNKPTQEGQFQHFLALAKLSIPFPYASTTSPAALASISIPKPSCAWLKPPPTSRPSRKPAANCRSPTGSLPSDELQGLLGRRQSRPGRHRYRRTRPYQRSLRRFRGNGAHGRRRTPTMNGPRPANSNAATDDSSRQISGSLILDR